MTTKDTQILTKPLVNYAEQSSKAEAQLSALQAQIEAMTIQQHPRVEVANNDVYQQPMGPPPGYGAQQEYGIYMPQQQTTAQGPHPGPFGSNNEWSQWNQAGHQLRESIKRSNQEESKTKANKAARARTVVDVVEVVAV